MSPPAVHEERRVQAARRRRQLVNVASINAFRSEDRYPLAGYVASKAGVVGLTRELAAQWGRRGIRVNAIAPGYFPTEMTGLLEDQEQVAWIRAHTALGRPAEISELDGTLLFLATRASTYLTGPDPRHRRRLVGVLTYRSGEAE
jgi:NAD(P)-dependent dehydrogenase (short-subunit alcohol dehydrogenase family)